MSEEGDSFNAAMWNEVSDALDVATENAKRAYRRIDRLKAALTAILDAAPPAEIANIAFDAVQNDGAAPSTVVPGERK